MRMTGENCDESCNTYGMGTLYMKLTLVIDSTSVIRWWVDMSHMTHMDCKGHTGGMMSLG